MKTIVESADACREVSALTMLQLGIAKASTETWLTLAGLGYHTNSGRTTRSFGYGGAVHSARHHSCGTCAARKHACLLVLRCGDANELQECRVALSAAAARGDMDMFNYLVASGVDPSVRDGIAVEQLTPLLVLNRDMHVWYAR